MTKKASKSNKKSQTPQDPQKALLDLWTERGVNINKDPLIVAVIDDGGKIHKTTIKI